MFSQQGALNVPQMPRFSLFFTSKANQPKTLVFTLFWQDNMQKKHDVLTNFSAHVPPFKKPSFFFYFGHRSSGLKKALNRAKLLNCT